MATPTARQKYEGPSRKLVLAFDIGTTFSGISYSILDPGYVPDIKAVTRYPYQESSGGDTKIPSAIWYDEEGQPCATGAGALKEGIEIDAKENGWSKAQWFKLHLRPTVALIARTSFAPARSWDGKDLIPPLPPNKSVTQVCSDWIRVLFSCARDHIQQTHGEKLWSTVEDDITFVLTHPNGWGGEQQAQMRQAAVLAGLVPDTDAGSARVVFVTEGEASLHFCLSDGLSPWNDNSGVLVVDAGGGTIDVTAYRKASDAKFEEISVPTCYFQGAAYVTVRAQHYFEGLLCGTRFNDDIETMTTRFDRGTKHVFKNPDEAYHIQFASHREREPALNIRGGRLTVPGYEIAKFFEPSITCILNAIHAHRATAETPIKTVYLVGGFSASTWVYSKVKEHLEHLGISIYRPDSHVNKVVSNGAISFYLDGLVARRVSRFTYGSPASAIYNPHNPQHVHRANRLVIDHISDIDFADGTKVDAHKEYRQQFIFNMQPGAIPRLEHVPVFVYSGSHVDNIWMDDNRASLRTLCTIEADTSKVKPEWRLSSRGVLYQQILYEVVLLLGSAELKAQVAYFEDGVEKRGPAKIVYGANA